MGNLVGIDPTGLLRSRTWPTASGPRRQRRHRRHGSGEGNRSRSTAPRDPRDRRHDWAIRGNSIHDNACSGSTSSPTGRTQRRQRRRRRGNHLQNFPILKSVTTAPEATGTRIQASSTRAVDHVRPRLLRQLGVPELSARVPRGPDVPRLRAGHDGRLGRRLDRRNAPRRDQAGQSVSATATDPTATRRSSPSGSSSPWADLGPASGGTGIIVSGTDFAIRRR